MSEQKSGGRKPNYAIYVILILIAAIAIIAVVNGVKRENSQQYMGHGFEYMHGYSSTDFTGYHVYDSEKLYRLDHDAFLNFEKEEDMPVLDGAEACYPVYGALALAAYPDIAKIELSYKNKAEEKFEKRDFGDDYDLMDVYYSNGKYVSFTNSSQA